MLDEYVTGENDGEGKPKTEQRFWDVNAIGKVDDHTVRSNLKAPQLTIPAHMFHHANAIIDPEEGGIFDAGSNGTGAFERASVGVGQKAVPKARKGCNFDGPQRRSRRIHRPGRRFLGVAGGDGLEASAHTADCRSGPPRRDRAVPACRDPTSARGTTAAVKMIIDRAPLDDARLTQAIRYATKSQQVVDAAVRGLGLAGEHHFDCLIHPEYAKLPET